MQNLNPDRLKALKQKSESLNEEKFKNFPVRVFPNPIKEYIAHCCSVKGYSPDIYGASIFAALASAVGKSHKLYTFNGYEATANYFLMLVGSRGINKSEPLKDAMAPIDQFQAKDYERYKFLLNNHKQNPEHYPIKPFWGKHLMSDATPEAITVMLANFPRGTTLKVDEMGSVLLALDKYRKGADEQFYLSAWSNETISRDRITGDQVMAVKPCLSMVGTIQNEVLSKVLFGKEVSGFNDRFLFCAPRGLTVPYASTSFIDPKLKLQYGSIISKLLDFNLDAGNETTYLTYSNAAKELVNTWDMRIVDILNLKETTETEKGIRAKLRIYIHRFALVIQMSIFSCTGEDSDRNEISAEAASSAIDLAEYFYSQAHQLRIKDKSDLLPEPYKSIYAALPDDEAQFPTCSFIELCSRHEIGSRMAKKWLKENSDPNNPDRLIRWVKHGIYSKKL